MIEVKGLTKSYDILVVDHVDFTIPDRGLTFIHGKSGCGKSTLLNMMSGLDLDYQGEIKINGQVLNEKNASQLRSQYMAYMNQRDELINEMTIKQNIQFIKEMTKSTLDTDLFFKKFDLVGLENEYPNELSGGELSLVCLLKNLLLSRQYLLLDEPNAKLDKRKKGLLKEFLFNLSKSMSIIIVSHDLEYMDNADCLIKIEHKKVIVERNDAVEKQKVKKSTLNFNLKSELKLIWANVKSNFLKYLFSSIVLFVLIVTCFTFFNIGDDLYPQFAQLIDKSENLQCIQIGKMNCPYSVYEEIREESIVEKVDYSLDFLFPPADKGKTSISIGDKTYSFADLPVTYEYHREDDLKENEILISRHLMEQLGLSIGDSMELTIHFRISQTLNEDGLSYTPNLEGYTYNAVIAGNRDSLLDTDIKAVYDLANHVTVSYAKVERLMREYIDLENEEMLLSNRGAKIYVKKGVRLSEVVAMLEKYDMAYEDLHQTAKDVLESNQSTYSILKVYGTICAVLAVIFIMTSMSGYHRYEMKQYQSLDLLGVSSKKVLKLQLIQNLMPFVMASVVSLVTIQIMIPMMNHYFYEQKLFYEPFQMVSQFLKEDFSVVQILLFDMMSWLKIVVCFGSLMAFYKVMLFRKMLRKK